MAIPNSNITEDYAALRILRQSQLNTAMGYINTQFNTYTKNNFIQIGFDVFGNTYDYNNDGVQTYTPALVDRVSLLAGDQTFTGENIFEKPVEFQDIVVSNSTFTSSGQMRCRAYVAGGNQVIADAALTAVIFNTENFDVGSIHDNAINASRITIPIDGGGLYLFHGQITFAASATGRRQVYLYKNGAAYAEAKANVSDAALTEILHVESIDQSTDGDFYELRVFQNSGGNLDVVQGAAVSFFEAIKVW